MCVVGLARIVFDMLATDGWHPTSLVAAGHYVPALAAAAVYFVGSFAARFGWTIVEQGDLSSATQAQFGPGFEFLAAGVLLSLGMLLAIQFKLAGAIGAMIVAIPVVVAKYGLDQFAQRGSRHHASTLSRAASRTRRESDSGRRRETAGARSSGETLAGCGYSKEKRRGKKTARGPMGDPTHTVGAEQGPHLPNRQRSCTPGFGTPHTHERRIRVQLRGSSERSRLVGPGG
jgi:uncharacterized membrane protein YccF (DUF307 family)